MKRIASLCALYAMLCWMSAWAAPVTIELPPEPEQNLRVGEGQAVTANNCQSCHSLDYIETQPMRKGAPFWDAEVKKMIQVFGAPISEADAKQIAAYLAQTY